MIYKEDEVMDIYEPMEDSFLLEKYVRRFAKGLVLDIGTGSGIQALAALERSDFVIAVDINQEAIDLAKSKIRPGRILFLRSDLFSIFESKYVSIEDGKAKVKDVNGKERNRFDTIIFNPPYLPDEENAKDIALDGGKEGHEVIGRFLADAKSFLADKGIILLIFSSFTGKQKVDAIIKENNFRAEELEKVHVSFEDIYCYKISALI
jgi:release factor glutamine methyltransferase